jgi:superfamily II DNA/RNA helicase
LNEKPKGTSVLVLAPTRELANQTDAACRELAPKNIRCAAMIGGAGYRVRKPLLRGAILSSPRRATC